jgi:hypothetical protein
LGQFSKNHRIFYQKICHPTLKNMGVDPRSGIRDPGSEIRDPEKNLVRIPDPGPGVKKATDPGSGSATLLTRYQVLVTFNVGDPCHFGIDPDADPGGQKHLLGTGNCTVPKKQHRYCFPWIIIKFANYRYNKRRSDLPWKASLS